MSDRIGLAIMKDNTTACMTLAKAGSRVALTVGPYSVALTASEARAVRRWLSRFIREIEAIPPEAAQ